MGQGGITILVGTTKGAFLISGGSDRRGWSVNGPFCDEKLTWQSPMAEQSRTPRGMSAFVVAFG